MIRGVIYDLVARKRHRWFGRRDGGSDDLTGITNIEVDVWVILRRFSANALKLSAANAHDRHPNFIMILRITFHIQLVT